MTLFEDHMNRAIAAIEREFLHRRGLMATTVARDKAVAAVKSLVSDASDWQPPADREDGYRCLTLRKGDWAFATWRSGRWWVAGYPCTVSVFAPLPPVPQSEQS